MDQKTFKKIVNESHKRCIKILNKKEKEYSEGKDRLDQFKKVASFRSTNPADALYGMAVKHFSSLSDMCKDPTNYPIEMWEEKIIDAHNYLYLLTAIIKEMLMKGEN